MQACLFLSYQSSRRTPEEPKKDIDGAARLPDFGTLMELCGNLPHKRLLWVSDYSQLRQDWKPTSSKKYPWCVGWL